MENNRNVLIACVWTGPLFAVMVFGGMFVAGMLPPQSPGESPADVAQFWNQHPDLTRFGLLLMLTSGGLIATFSSVLCILLKRIEGPDSPMAWLQSMAATLSVLAVTIPTMLFMATAFRPERAPEITRVLTDLAWINYVVNYPAATLALIAVAVAVLASKKPNYIFPRWVGYYNAWSALLMIPGGFVAFFKSGPFAWDGLLAFWLVAVDYGIWFIVMTAMMLRAIKHPSFSSTSPKPLGNA